MTAMDLAVEVAVSGESLESVDPIISAEKWQLWLETWLSMLSPALSPIAAYELSLQFVTDAAIAQLNRDYRQRDQPTDVLSFAVLDGGLPAPELLKVIPVNLGDIIISVETAQRQCKIHQHSLKQELTWLAAHGLLHLLGWDHPDESSLQAMWSQQRSLLTQIGIQLDESAYFWEDTTGTVATNES